MLIGVISETHGTLPPSVAAAFRGVDRILHAGDVGSETVLDELAAIAPVVAVSGNTDVGPLDWRLPGAATIACCGLRVHMTHRPQDVPKGLDADVVVTGHTHRALVAHRDGVLHVNPGPAGAAARDGRGPTVALLDCAARPVTARIVEL